ncbi:hypothetical protein DLAC_02023 [Tieghemostelium lacteum]|uniref:Uncharacterized protein n=1 Tax=Tieghemostelium lacteum TaxID=361077 RepID=A0A152A4Y7_TIELA|nr:hypothetical protein DLAC_02023 [Tieghemostelium lacteum]|eukprot:KYR01303.1 hypothetical protein DLAC_02023 [Tieghemostelium lacteum]
MPNNHKYSRNLMKHFKTSLNRPLQHWSRVNWYYGGTESIQSQETFCKGVDGLEIVQVLHPFKKIPGSKKLLKDVYIGGKFKDLSERLSKKEIDESQILMLMGCTVWNNGQLQKELEQGHWYLAKTSKNILLNPAKDDTMWYDALKSIGGDQSELTK